MDVNFNINADVGEGMGDDAGLIPLLQSCNIACGGHAGGKNLIKKTIRLATTHNVNIGAHPSYPDPENFGRLSLHLSKKMLYQTLDQQICLILDQLNSVKLHHVKPHGALYHDCNNDERIAILLLEVLKSLCPHVIIFTPTKSILEKQALKNGFNVWTEAFMDRAYQDDGQLVSRSKKNAILSEPKQLYERFENLLQRNGVFSINDLWIPLRPKTICIHGDHPNAAENLFSVLNSYKKNHLTS